MTAKSKSAKGFASVGDILEKFKSDEDKQSLPLEFSRDKYISREFQKYGYELAKELGDLKNKSLYMKLAKETSRGLLENARNFVKDASKVRSRPKLFMWKLSELRKVRKAGTKEERN